MRLANRFVTNLRTETPEIENVMSAAPRERFQDLLEGFSTGMLVTQEPSGPLHARPMRVAEATSDGDLWFATRKPSSKTYEIASDSQVAVTFQGGGKYLSVNGAASICTDREKIHELWNESWKVWFPDGKDEPELALLKVEATDGEYWDNSGFRGLTYAIRAGQAYWQGEAVESTEEINAKVTL